MKRLISAALVLVAAITMDRSDGSKQCEPAPSARAVLAGAKKELRSAGVSVLEIRRAQDGKMRMQMCGSPTGSVIRIRIRESDREKASALGFSPVASDR